MKHTFSVAAFAMIWDDQGRILLCLRNDLDLWNLPGGGLDAGESPWE
jgi:8-oxo-dGTP pyrophosphatase MutT (NUDIX family)